MSERQYFDGIKECPECFSRLADSQYFDGAYDEPEQFMVRCPNCGQEGPVKYSAAKALRAWNTDANFQRGSRAKRGRHPKD